MIRIVRTRTLREADSQVVELHHRAECQRTRAEELAAEIVGMQQAANHSADFLIRAEDDAERLHKQLLAARDDAARVRGELDALRSQHLLDTEDRVVLRMLLRTARKQQARTDRVHVLYRFGVVHSVHATRDAAETAAEDEGADRGGWTSPSTCCVTPPEASEIPWRIQSLMLGSVK